MNRLGLVSYCLALVVALVLGCSSAQGPEEAPPPSSPGLEVSAEDYPTARSRFRTKLLRAGPAAPDGVRARVPGGSVEIFYESAGLKLQAFASPNFSGQTRQPALLYLHGGFALEVDHWEQTRPFRETGFVVMIPSLRGENGQPGAFTLFHEEVGDVLAALEVLASRPDVDPGRLYVAGHSVGGTLALLSALSSDRVRAAASFSGSPDQVIYTRGRPDRVPFVASDENEFRLRSPVAFATHFRCPVRIYRGEDEHWLDASSRRTAILAQKAGLDVREVEVSGGHDTARPEVIAACVAFFRRH